ncbi:MAG: hypothetical protein R3331_04400 [Sulfurospirillaceae bacterium]|nr:hypothetical protein [Sulfurospirillaceae bacterium]
MFYSSELNAIKKSNRYRKREFQADTKHNFTALKSSRIMKGYPKIHKKEFEHLCKCMRECVDEL